mgnify:CR=1 FL=1
MVAVAWRKKGYSSAVIADEMQYSYVMVSEDVEKAKKSVGWLLFIDQGLRHEYE